MATKTTTTDGESKTGGSWKMPKLVKWGIVAVIAFLVLKIGVMPIVDFLDPGGKGGLLDRIPHVTWHLGALAAFLGIIVALVRGWKDHGHHLIGYGVLAVLVGLLGPTALAHAGAGLPDAFGGFLDSLNGIDWNGLRLK